MFKRVVVVFNSFVKRIRCLGRREPILVFWLMLFVFLCYVIYGLQFKGPFILADELGYITKALAISGVATDAASSWQAGYSILITPIFIIFKDPDIQWKAVIVANAIMWSCSAGFLYVILRKYFPKKSVMHIAVAVLLTLAYPSFISSGSYSFATTAFILVLLMSLVVLLKSNFDFNRYLILFAGLAGYLYWMHPTAVVFVAVVLLVLFLKMCERRDLRYLYPIVLLILVSLIYSLIVKPWINDIMTPAGMPIRNHYDDFYVNIGSRISLLSYWLNVLGVFVGQLAYLLVASFGIISFGFSNLFKGFRLGSVKKWFRGLFDNTSNLIIAILVVTTVGVALMTGLYFPGDIIPLRGELWIYGRYVEMYVALLIGVGILSKWNFRIFVQSAACVFSVASLFLFILNSTNTVQDPEYYGVIVYMWPSIFTETPSVATLLFIGSIGVFIVGMISLRYKKNNVMWLILPILVVTLSAMYTRHYYGSKSFDGYSEMVSIVKNNYPKNTCVGLDIDANHDQIDDVSYFKFYLQDYDVRRVKPAEWPEKCNGVYLTYNRGNADSIDSATIVAKDKVDGLYLMVNNDSADKITIDEHSENLRFMLDDSSKCDLNICANWKASDVNNYETKVGKYENGLLLSTNKQGYLLKSDKFYLNEGLYRIDLKMKYDNSDKVASLEIVGGESVDLYTIAPRINDFQRLDYSYEFRIPVSTSAAQVRLYVGDSSRLEVESYKITEIR